MEAAPVGDEEVIEAVSVSEARKDVVVETVGSDTALEEAVEVGKDSIELVRSAVVEDSTAIAEVESDDVEVLLRSTEEVIVEVRGRAGISTVTGGELTFIIEYPVVVTVAGDGLIVTREVSVASGPSIVFVTDM